MRPQHCSDRRHSLDWPLHGRTCQQPARARRKTVGVWQSQNRATGTAVSHASSSLLAHRTRAGRTLPAKLSSVSAVHRHCDAAAPIVLACLRCSFSSHRALGVGRLPEGVSRVELLAVRPVPAVPASKDHSPAREICHVVRRGPPHQPSFVSDERIPCSWLASPGCPRPLRAGRVGGFPRVHEALLRACNPPHRSSVSCSRWGVPPPPALHYLQLSSDGESTARRHSLYTPC